jgi:hypothetical protein
VCSSDLPQLAGPLVQESRVALTPISSLGVLHPNLYVMFDVRERRTHQRREALMLFAMAD